MGFHACVLMNIYTFFQTEQSHNNSDQTFIQTLLHRRVEVKSKKPTRKVQVQHLERNRRRLSRPNTSTSSDMSVFLSGSLLLINSPSSYTDETSAYTVIILHFNPPLVPM